MAEMKIDIRSDVHQAPEDLREVNQALDVMEQKAEEAGKKLKMIGDRASAIGKKMTLFITAPLLAAGGAAIKLAMDAEESRNLFEVSMGGMVDVAEKWSEQLSDSLGINRFESQKLIGTFNVMLKSMGLSEKGAYDMSKGMAELTYDMASFYNLEPEVAFQKLQAGITGEIEPLKRLGIVIKDETIKTWALTNGMIKQGETMDENQKIQARYNVIMEQTTLAQGDMARTLDSPTNKLRVLKSRITETAIEFGMKMMPAFENLLKVIEKGVKWFGDMSDSSRVLTIKIAAVAASIGPLLIGIGKFIKIAPQVGKAIKAMTGPFGLVTIAILAAGAAIDYFIKKSIEMSDKEIAAMTKTKSALAESTELRKSLIEADIVSVEEWGAIFNKHGRSYERVMRAIATLPEYEEIRNHWKGMTETVSESSDKMGTKIELLAIPIQYVITNIKKFKDTIDLELVPTLDMLMEKFDDFTPAADVVGDFADDTGDYMDQIIQDAIGNTERMGLTQEQFKEGQLMQLSDLETGIVDFINLYEQGMEGMLETAKRFAIAEAVKWIMARPLPFPIKLIAAIGAMTAIEGLYKTIASLEQGGILMGPQVVEAGHGRGEAIIPLEKLPQVVKEITKETVSGPIAITIIVQDQIDPYSAQRMVRDIIIPQILEALDANHMKKIWQKRLGVD